MRDFIQTYINGKRHEIRGRRVFLSLSDYLRQELGLTGTKIVCSEGDCGACTVLVGRKLDQEFRYQPVDSCILFMFQMEGTHVVTIEGIAPTEQLSAVQQAMVDCHGSQCGFCTPGFVMSMAGLLEGGSSPEEVDYCRGLTGNLCRCTGYLPILEATQQLTKEVYTPVEDQYPSEPIVAELSADGENDIQVEDASSDRTQLVFSPASLASALDFLKHNPRAVVIAGATDVGVRANKAFALPDTILDLNRIPGLQGVAIQDGQLVMGARATWTAIAEVCEQAVPEFHRILTIFGAPQIRHVGTVGGNLINASPIADSLPFFYVMEAELELQSASGSRLVNINEFYQGYKQFDLRPGELLTQIRVPLPAEGDLLKLFKISRRLDLDISTFTGAVHMQLDGDVISHAAVALGAVGPTVLRPRSTEEFLIGQPFTEDTMERAGQLVVDEITPISDVRGSADYRFQLAHNMFLKLFHEHQEVSVPT